MASNTTQRSLAWLRENGYTPTVVEHYNAYARRKFDLYGFIDIVALHPKLPGLLGIQTTTGAHLQDRIRKAKALDTYHLWIACGNRVLFMGWRKLGGRWAPMLLEMPGMDIFS
jgi:hypothetical protein